MQSLKSPYILYNQQSVGSTLHNNLLFITDSPFLISYCDYFSHNRSSCSFLSVALPFAGFYFCSFVHIRKHSEDLVGSLIL